jgi:hypothetical protein
MALPHNDITALSGGHEDASTSRSALSRGLGVLVLSHWGGLVFLSPSPC